MVGNSTNCDKSSASVTLVPEMESVLREAEEASSVADEEEDATADDDEGATSAVAASAIESLPSVAFFFFGFHDDFKDFG